MRNYSPNLKACRENINMMPKNELEDILVNFFYAENNRNWKVYETFISPDVEWILYGSPKRKAIIGKAEYVDYVV